MWEESEKKIIAANNNGLSKVYVPIGNRFQDPDFVNETNMSEVPRVDLVELGEILGIEVVEVGILDDILEDLYGVEQRDSDFTVPSYYFETMQGISDRICTRANTLPSSVSGSSDFLLDYYEVVNETNNYTGEKKPITQDVFEKTDKHFQIS